MKKPNFDNGIMLVFITYAIIILAGIIGLVMVTPRGCR